MSDQIESQASIKNKTDNTLVTFAIFGYNQANFIREAIQGAFEQTYECMEVILSDDCSTDGTFEIMCEMAKNYVGPKKVFAQRTERNIGTLAHVVDVAKKSKGNLLVLAAGDDISKPERTERLVKEWLETGAWGLCSMFDRIDEKGGIISKADEVSILSSPGYRLRKYINMKYDDIKIVHGATSAYDKRIFESLSLSAEDYILSEDGVMSVLLNILGKKISKIDESLIFYRESSQSLTNGFREEITLDGIREDEWRIERFARSQANRCSLFLRLNEQLKENGTKPLNEDLLRLDYERQRTRADWSKKSCIRRLSYIVKNFEFEELKWALPRILSVPAFLVAKMLVRKTSKYFSGIN